MAGVEEVAVEPDEDQENRDPLVYGKTMAFAKPAPRAPLMRPAARAASRVPLDWSLKTGVTFATRAALGPLRSWAQRVRTQPPSGSPVPKCDSMEDIGDALGFYRFPFPNLNQLQKRKISALFTGRPTGKRGNKEAEEHMRADMEYYEVLLSSWRRALQSLYDGLKGSKGGHFYYFHHDFAALFRHDPEAGLEAVLCRCGETVRTALQQEHIAFEEVSPHFGAHDDQERDDHDRAALAEHDTDHGASAEHDTDHDASADEGDDPDASADDASADEADRNAIRMEISDRIKRCKLKKIRRRTQQNGSVRIRDVHAFVDFLVNQRNGRSYVVLPELVSPVGFLHGTYCRNELVVHGADLDGVGRVRVTGAVLPEAVARIRATLETLLAPASIDVSCDADPRTLALTALKHEGGME